jgi:hypothetical protein
MVPLNSSHSSSEGRHNKINNRNITIYIRSINSHNSNHTDT